MAIISLLKRFWPLIVGLIVLGAIYAMVIHYGNTRYQEGVEATKQTVRDQIAKQDTLNREKENEIQKGIDAADEKYINERNSREKAEQKYQDSIKDKLSKTPFIQEYQCTIPEDVLRERNAIRALGPKEEI